MTLEHAAPPLTTLASDAKRSRDQTIDLLRGLAIFTMVAANLAGNILQEPHPFLFRFYGTFAAPTFILLAGMMIGAANAPLRPARGLGYYLKRGAGIALVGALIDIFVWHYYPFTTFDVLYLIGFATPMAYAATRLTWAWQWALPMMIFALTPWLQHALGYQLPLDDLPLKTVSLPTALDHLPDTARHLMIDGWFPLFPWVGFALFGVAGYGLRSKWGASFPSKALLPSVVLLALGVTAWAAHPGPLVTRGGYSELFYPPTWGYLLTALGLIASALSVLPRVSHWAVWTPWVALGQCSLLIYVLHYVSIHYIFAALWPEVAFPQFVALYLIFVSALMGVALGVRGLKNRFPSQPGLVRFFIGG